MKKTYNPKDIEESTYKFWEQNGYFKPNFYKNKKSFCIVIPPPNITGSLHMGHAFQYTIIDIMIRYQRMQGKNTLWQTGIDHAGIATQAIVEDIISKEGKSLLDYSRDDFIKKVWQWQVECKKTITYQMRRLSSSIDWKRERFTMDEGFSSAVRKVFVTLYKDGLIYRGKRLVNWDVKLRTAISDLEVSNCKLRGTMWYIRYPLLDGIKTVDGKNYLVVATSRPETMFGDVSVAINPEDLRYKNLIGKFILLPLINRRIPIIGDKYANIHKGTGCVRITPAHDFNDFKVGRRHKLPMINIMTMDGKISENAQIFDTNGNISNIYSDEIPIEFQKLERFSARKSIVAAVNNIGLLDDVKSQDLIVSFGDRSGVIIEPILTDQWYLRTNILAKSAIEVVKYENIKFIPKEYKEIYFSWMYEIKDWCISRQLWWGHRIPAWYDNDGNIYVECSEKEVRQKNNINTDTILTQDNDVLDTWFSSSLWAFCALGWPDNTDILNTFYPTNVMVSGFDIIFFWIARMIMMSLYLIKDSNGKPKIPFKKIYVTGLIRDSNGQKMSKSKGNIIDPLDIIDGISLNDLINKRTCNVRQSHLINKICKYTKKQFPNGIKPFGADVLRLSLSSSASTGNNINWNIDRLERYRNFCNKIWNAGLFVLRNTKNFACGFNGENKLRSLADRWIISKFNQTVNNYRNALDELRFNIATDILYKFIWNQFCDWYIELTKPILKFGNKLELCGTRNTLIFILESILRLAHPIIPSITESIWQQIKTIANIKADTIMLQPFPEFNSNQVDEISLADISWLKKIITIIRNVRSEMNISLKQPINLLLYNYNDLVLRRINDNCRLLKTIAHIENITILSSKDYDLLIKKKNSILVNKIIDNTELIIPINNLVDKSIESNRLIKEILKINKKIDDIERRLTNLNFRNKAPKEVISKDREKLLLYKSIKEKLTKQQNIVNIYSEF